MAETSIQALLPADQSVLLQLNNDHAAELSWLEAAEFGRMIDGAFYARGCGGNAAFLLAFDQSAVYSSPNFLWFRSHYPRFVYVDRIVVAPHARGRGLARVLYEDLFKRARASGHTTVCCEVNSEPPNPASDAFHAALGFLEVGSARIHDGTKSVRYFRRDL